MNASWRAGIRWHPGPDFDGGITDTTRPVQQRTQPVF
jgi:hypothetical protein